MWYREGKFKEPQGFPSSEHKWNGPTLTSEGHRMTMKDHMVHISSCCIATPSHLRLWSTWNVCENLELKSSLDKIWSVMVKEWPWKVRGSKSDCVVLYTITFSYLIKTKRLRIRRWAVIQARVDLWRSQEFIERSLGQNAVALHMYTIIS